MVLKVTLVFCFGPKPKFCSFNLDLDQAEIYYTPRLPRVVSQAVEAYFSNVSCSSVFHLPKLCSIQSMVHVFYLLSFDG